MDDDGASVVLAEADAASLLEVLGGRDGLEAATVSACPTCRSCVVAVVALADLIAAGPPHPAARDLLELADDAPTLHLYVLDSAGCQHRGWRDPGYEEWIGAVAPAGSLPRRP